MSQISATSALQSELLRRVKALGHRHRERREAAARPTVSHTVPVFRPGQFDVVCIGSSTGGPPVVEKLLSALPPTFHTPVVIAQHMPAVFTKSMAERLSRDCKLRVVHADQRMALEPKTIYLTQGNHNVHLRKKGLARWELDVNTEPSTTIYWPSVDVLLKTATTATGSRTLAIILTGIGEDGLQGARELHKHHGVILAQDAHSCVVYGMPKAVTENNLIAASLTPDQMIQSLQSLDGGVGAVSRAG